MAAPALRSRNEHGNNVHDDVRAVADMTLFCQYENGVFPTPERWTRLSPRQEAKLVRRRLRKRRFERWDMEGGPWLDCEIDEIIEEDDFSFGLMEHAYVGRWPEAWNIGGLAYPASKV
jgi:hypothetical protein